MPWPPRTVPGLRERLVAPSPAVARLLLGALLTHDTAEGRVTVRLTEVEAYAGARDPASHAYRGRTARNGVMFGPAGHLYVYFSYGMHWCANVVTGPAGEASAVLLRAGEVVEGVDLAGRRRGARVTFRGLARGPACLTQALGVDRSSDGADLCDAAGLRLEAGEPVPSSRVLTGPRVGVSVAYDVPWRFWLAEEPTVSAYRRSPRAGRPGDT